MYSWFQTWKILDLIASMLFLFHLISIIYNNLIWHSNVKANVSVFSLMDVGIRVLKPLISFASERANILNKLQIRNEVSVC